MRKKAREGDMENSISEIPNDLPTARKQYQNLLEYGRKLDKLFAMLGQFLKEGKRGDVSDEYLADQRKRSEKTRRNMLNEKKALEEKIKELQQDTTLQSERKTKNVELKKNSLLLITQNKPPAQEIPAKTVVTGKLVQIRPMPLPEVQQIEKVTLLKTQELQPYTSIKRIAGCIGIPECIQTMSPGNEEKYSLHVLSKTGAPHVSLNLSLSKPSSPDLSCVFTTTRKGMMLTSTTSKIQQLPALKELMPYEEKYSSHVLSKTGATHVSLNLLLSKPRVQDLSCVFTTTRKRIMITSTTSKIQSLRTLMPLEQLPGTGCKSLSVTELTLPRVLPEDASNCLLINMLQPLSLLSTLLPRQLWLPIMESSQLPLASLPPKRSSSLSVSIDIRMLLTALLQPSVRYYNHLCVTPTTSEMLLPALESAERVMQERSQLLLFVSVPPQLSPPPVTELKSPPQLSPVAELSSPLQPCEISQASQAQDQQSSLSAVEDSFATPMHSEVERKPSSEEDAVPRTGDSQELRDSTQRANIEVTEVDEALKASDAEDTFKSGCDKTESNIPRSKKKRSIGRRIFALFTCCFRN